MGASGWRWALEFQPQLMIVDWVMPETAARVDPGAAGRPKIGRSIYILVDDGDGTPTIVSSRRSRTVSTIS